MKIRIAFDEEDILQIRDIFRDELQSIFLRIETMTQLIDDLLLRVTEQTTVSDGLRVAVTGLTDVATQAVQVSTSAISTLQQLKAALEALIANGSLTSNDRVALQSALDKATQDSASDSAKALAVAASASALAASAQNLADAVIVNSPSN